MYPDDIPQSFIDLMNVYSGVEPLKIETFKQLIHIKTSPNSYRHKRWKLGDYYYHFTDRENGYAFVQVDKDGLLIHGIQQTRYNYHMEKRQS